MKKIYKYLIVICVLILFIISSIYVYKYNGNEYDKYNVSINNSSIDEELVIPIKSLSSGLSRIELLFSYEYDYDNHVIDYELITNNKTVEKGIINTKELDSKNYYININKSIDSKNKNYTLKIKVEDDYKVSLNKVSIEYYRWYYKAWFIFVIITLSLITLVVTRFVLNSKNIKLEKYFLILSIIIYLSYICLMPLFTSHDEFCHWSRAYEISEGHLLSGIKDHYAQTELPCSTKEVFNKDYLEITYKSTMKSFEVTEDRTKLCSMDMKTTSVYSPVQYIPQSLGIIVGKITHKPLIMAYLGRIMNALVSIILIYLSIKLIPFGKRIMFTIGFIPIAIEGFTSLSADAITLSMSMLFIAYVLYLKFTKKIVEKKDIILLLIMSITIALCKIVYLPLILLLFILPNNIYKSKKHKWLINFSILMISVIANFTWLLIASKYLKLYETSGTQATSIFKDIFGYIQIFIYTILNNNKEYVYTMFGSQLGWSENIKPLTIIPLGFMLLTIINTLSEKEPLKKLKLWDIIIMLFIIVTVIGLIFTSLYIQWSKPGSMVIDGIQGRYFLPILPLILLLTSFIKFNYKGNLNLDKVTIITCLLLNVSVLLTIFISFT